MSVNCPQVPIPGVSEVRLLLPLKIPLKLTILACNAIIAVSQKMKCIKCYVKIERYSINVSDMLCN